jgi:hypothetical protein
VSQTGRAQMSHHTIFYTVSIRCFYAMIYTIREKETSGDNAMKQREWRRDQRLRLKRIWSVDRSGSEYPDGAEGGSGTRDAP